MNMGEVVSGSFCGFLFLGHDIALGGMRGNVPNLSKSGMCRQRKAPRKPATAATPPTAAVLPMPELPLHVGSSREGGLAVACRWIYWI